jgi:4-methyl-5(b-hydroxyethyl)-thiazole monophosphate biosynthesis
VWVFWLRIDAAYSLNEIHGDKFEMVIYIWWWGCLTQYLHDTDYLRIAKEAKKLWAICIAPMVVSESGVFNWKIVTSRDDEWLQQNFIENYGGVRKDEWVIRYGNIVTANGPEAAELFGNECVKLLEDWIEK